MGMFGRMTSNLEPSALTIKYKELLTDKNKDAFRILYTMHKLYPNAKLILTRDVELNLDYIDKLREKEEI